MTFSSIFALKDQKKIFFWGGGVGRSEVPKTEKVMAKGAGKVQSNPLPTTQCVGYRDVRDMYKMYD